MTLAAAVSRLAILALAACAAQPVRDDARPDRACLAPAELERVAARPPSAAELSAMNKLDPTLHRRVRAVEQAARWQRERVASSAPAAASCLDAHVWISVDFTGPIAELLALGFEPIALEQHPDGTTMADGRIPPSRLRELVALPHVIAVEAPPETSPEVGQATR